MLVPDHLSPSAPTLPVDPHTMSTSTPPSSTPPTSTTSTVPPPNNSTQSSGAPADASPDPERTAQARAALTTHLNALGNSHLQPLEARAKDIHAASSSLESQKTKLEKQTKDLEKESEKLHKQAEKQQDKLRELGDIQNWAEVLERDIRVLEETVKMGEGERMEWEEEDDDEAGLLEDGREPRPDEDLPAEGANLQGSEASASNETADKAVDNIQSK